MTVEPYHGSRYKPLKIPRRSDIDLGLGLNRAIAGSCLARGICLAGS